MGTQKFKGFQDQYEPRFQKYFAAIALPLLQNPTRNSLNNTIVYTDA